MTNDKDHGSEIRRPIMDEDDAIEQLQDEIARLERIIDEQAKQIAIICGIVGEIKR